MATLYRIADPVTGLGPYSCVRHSESPTTAQLELRRALDSHSPETHPNPNDDFTHACASHCVSQPKLQHSYEKIKMGIQNLHKIKTFFVVVSLVTAQRVYSLEV